MTSSTRNSRPCNSRPGIRDVGIYGITLAATMIMAKLVCLQSVLSIGGTEALGPVGIWRFLAWFAQDIAFGMGFGMTLAALSLGAARIRPANRHLTLVTTAFRNIALFVICATLVPVCYVYYLLGMAPTHALAGELGGAGGNAKDSIASLFDGRATLSLVLFLLIAFGGKWLLRRFAFRKIAALRLAIILILSFVIAAGIATFSKRDSLDLDRNGMYSFLWTSVLRPKHDAMSADAIDGSSLSLAGILKPVLGEQTTIPGGDSDTFRQWVAASEKRQSHPNVVLIILETTATKHMQVTGGKEANTPNLAKMAKTGWLWNGHYSHLPLSMPSIYSILCSSFGVPFGKIITEVAPQIDCHSLPEILVASGYKAGLWHSGRFSFSEKDRFLKGRGYAPLLDATTMPGKETFRESSWGLEERAAVLAMTKWAKEQTGPFFATYIPVAPHHPYNLPTGEKGPFRKGGDVGLYTNAIHYVDKVLGELMQSFKSEGLAESTLFVFVGDHGEGFGEHSGSRMHGSKIFEEGVRSFVLWYAPGADLGSAIDTRLTGHADIVPTLLEVLGLSPKHDYNGESQLRETQSRMIPIFTDSAHRYIGFRDGDWKYIYNRKSDSHELYNLRDDPNEKHNVAESHKAATLSYMKQARMLIAFTRDQQQKQTQSKPADTAPKSQDTKWKDVASKTWSVSLKDCDRPEGYTKFYDADLRPEKVGKPTITCRLDIPEGVAGRLQSLKILGRDGVGGTWAEGNLQFSNHDGQSSLGYCKINNEVNCEAQLADDAIEFQGPGQLELDLRFVFFNKLPHPDHRPLLYLRGAEITYQELATGI
ncbi:MAG: sulfatase-like hydrolase/transferase [Kofleriaceae bacterium]|nr:sulfatase-like hydrolase/transferase [Kofleriaceae bacterium]